MTDTIKKYIRFAINDTVHTKDPGDVFEFASNNVFTLSELNVDEIVAVRVNGASHSTYTLDGNRLTVTGLTVGDIVEVVFTYTDYSDAELRDYFYNALFILSNRGYKTFVVDDEDETVIAPSPSVEDTYLIAALVALLMKPEIDTYKLSEVVSVKYTGAGSTASKEFKISQLIASANKSQGVWGWIDTSTMNGIADVETD